MNEADLGMINETEKFVGCFTWNRKGIRTVIDYLLTDGHRKEDL